MRALIAMEDKPYVDLLQSFLRRQGLDAEVAAGAPECRSVLREFAPDVVIVERDLPRGGSQAVLAGMDDDPRTRDVPVILIEVVEEDFDSADVKRVAGRLHLPFRLSDALGLIRYAAWRARSTRKHIGAIQ